MPDYGQEQVCAGTGHRGLREDTRQPARQLVGMHHPHQDRPELLHVAPAPSRPHHPRHQPLTPAIHLQLQLRVRIFGLVMQIGAQILLEHPQSLPPAAPQPGHPAALGHPIQQPSPGFLGGQVRGLLLHETDETLAWYRIVGVCYSDAGVSGAGARIISGHGCGGAVSGVFEGSVLVGV